MAAQAGRLPCLAGLGGAHRAREGRIRRLKPHGSRISVITGNYPVIICDNSRV